MPSASILRRTSAILSSRPSASTNRSRSVATKPRHVVAGLGTGPAGQRLVQPWIPGLVVADQRVEPLVRRLVSRDQAASIGTLEDEGGVLDALALQIGAERDGEPGPRVGAVQLGE